MIFSFLINSLYEQFMTKIYFIYRSLILFLTLFIKFFLKSQSIPTPYLIDMIPILQGFRPFIHTENE